MRRTSGMAVVLALLSAPCAANAGLPRDGRKHDAHFTIVGGQPAPPGMFPWLASIVDNLGPVTGKCTGTVVAPYLVLTAAHCAENVANEVERHPEGFRVYTGNVDWESPESQVSGVSEVIIDPQFVPRTDVGDAALLVLSSLTNAPPIALADELPPAETRARVAGWGRTTATAEPPATLQWGETNVQSAGNCEWRDPGFDPTAQVCAADTANLSTIGCLGDSGGPLLVPSSLFGTVELGVYDEGVMGCSPEYAGIYAAAPFIAPWVSVAIGALAGLAEPISGAPVSPTPGRYATARGAGHLITFRVMPDGRHIGNLTAEALISCDHGASTSYGVAAFTAGREPPIAISGEATIRQELRVAGSRFYKPGIVGLYLRFIRPGLAEGRLRLRVRPRSRRYGVCYSAAVRFFARFAGG